MLNHVGNYELLRPLGAGGMAQTFVARRRGLAGFEQHVCLKRVLPEYAFDPGLIEQFLDEARLLAQLRHANVVQVYDFGQAGGSYFIALELVDGVDLQTLIRQLRAHGTKLAAAPATYIVTEMLKALDYAHNARIGDEPLKLVHRDVSPSNVLLSRQGEVKLADFGIARSRQRRHKTQAGKTKGKVAYMSPEQVQGDELDARSDLFSVGIVMHELLTGVHPFEASTDVAVLGKLLSGTRPSLDGLTDSVRPELLRLLDAFLAIDPNLRPSSAAEALACLPALHHSFRTTRELADLVKRCAESVVNSQTAHAGRPELRRPVAPEALATETIDSTSGTSSDIRGGHESSPRHAEVVRTDAMRTSRSHVRRAPVLLATLALVLATVIVSLLSALSAKTPSAQTVALDHGSTTHRVEPAGSPASREQVTSATSPKPLDPQQHTPRNVQAPLAERKVTESVAPPESSVDPKATTPAKEPRLQGHPAPSSSAPASVKGRSEGLKPRGSTEVTSSRRSPGNGAEDIVDAPRAGVNFQANQF